MASAAEGLPYKDTWIGSPPPCLVVVKVVTNITITLAHSLSLTGNHYSSPPHLTSPNLFDTCPLSISTPEFPPFSLSLSLSLSTSYFCYCLSQVTTQTQFLQTLENDTKYKLPSKIESNSHTFSLNWIWISVFTTKTPSGSLLNSAINIHILFFENLKVVGL